MRSLNLRFRGKNNPTDVLSFGFQEDSANKEMCWAKLLSACLTLKSKRENWG